MLPDWVGWSALILSALAVIGVAYLILQTLIGAFPSLSYGIHFERPVFFWAGPEGRLARQISLTFTVRNRTSRDQRLRTNLAVVIERSPKGQAWAGLLDLVLFDHTTPQGGRIEPSEFTVPLGDAKRLEFRGALQDGATVPCVLEFSIGDSRFGRRQLDYHEDFEVEEFPSLPDRSPLSKTKAS